MLEYITYTAFTLQCASISNNENCFYLFNGKIQWLILGHLNPVGQVGQSFIHECDYLHNSIVKALRGNVVLDEDLVEADNRAIDKNLSNFDVFLALFYQIGDILFDIFKDLIKEQNTLIYLIWAV